MIRDEQTKLTANFLNGMGIATFAIGGLAPVFSTLYDDQRLSGFLIFVSVICFVAALTLHLVARAVLKGLKDDNA